MKPNQSTVGKLLVLGCILLLVSAILPWRIPLFRILLALAAVWMGIRLTQPRSDNQGAETEADDDQRFQYLFSQGMVDLTDSGNLPARADVRCALGQVTVRLPVDASVTIHVTSVMGNVSLPDRQNMVVGEGVCRCGSHDPMAPRLDIRANCVMGEIKFLMG